MRHGGVYTSAHPLPSDGDPPCRDTLDKAATGPEGPELSKAFNPPMSLPLNYTLYRSLATPLPPQMYFLPSTLTFFPVCTGLNASTEIRSSDEDFFCPLRLDDLGGIPTRRHGNIFLSHPALPRLPSMAVPSPHFLK